MASSLFRVFSESKGVHQLQNVLEAESLDGFARACQKLLRTSLRHHSIRVSFNDLEFFRPSLIRDTMPVRCDISYLYERNQHDPTPGFLRRHMGINASTYRLQLGNPNERNRAEFFQRFMRPEGWDKDAEVYFWDNHHEQLEAYLCVRRAPQQPEFGSDELKFLEDLRAALGGSVRRLRNQHREKLTSHYLHSVMTKLPIPILILDWRLDPVCFNGEARQICAEWLHGASASRAIKLNQFSDIPAEVIRVCLDAKEKIMSKVKVARAAGDRFAPPFQSIFHPRHLPLEAQVEVLDASRNTIGLPHFLVRFQRLEKPGRGVIELPTTDVAKLACLTPREREIAHYVHAGLTNDEIAKQLSKSVSTVKMQLQSIYRKLHVGNRTKLATLLG